jgi:hypothetical protein
MIDYQTLLYGPIYGFHGVDALITTPAGNVSVLVLDRTAGSSEKLGHGMIVETVTPMCRVRMPELAGGLAALNATITALDMASVIFSNRSWRIRSYEPKPSPNGEDDGELELILTIAEVVMAGGQSDGSSIVSGDATPRGEADGSANVTGGGATA